jgi:HlyD family secretion protein
MILKNKYIIPIISIIVIIFGIFWYFKSSNNLDKVPFKTQTPTRKDMLQLVDASGTLNAKDEISVGSLVAGRVIDIKVDDNDFVKKGQVLAILDNGKGDSEIKRLKAILWEAKANLEYQEKFYNRQKELFKLEQISKDSFEQYTSKLETLKARVDQTQAGLELTTKEYENLFIKSPDDGIVIAKKIDLGQMITSQLQATVLFVIAKDLQKMEAHVNVDEADIGMVKEGQKVEFTVDAFPKKTFNATVKQIRYLAEIVDNVVTYATILDVANPDLLLRPGMTTNVEIKVAQADNALVVHNKALRININSLEIVAKKLNYSFEKIPNIDQKNEIDHVWILENNNKFKQVKVELGVREGAYTQITSGINENTQVVYEVEKLKKEGNILKQIMQQPGGIGK